MKIFFYNTLTRQKEKFGPLDPREVRMYTCGPTVYDYQHIGNWRTFVFEDFLRRIIEYNAYKVNQVMNATDVGHLTGDNVGLADEGEDRMEKAAKRERKNIWEAAKFYIDDFVKTREWLSILPPTKFVRATDHIEEQIELIQKLVEKGLAYVTETGVFFDVLKLPDYGKLGGQKLNDKRAASRDELVSDRTKLNPADFALWKISKPEDRRQMEWNSPWGRGFPGWHIECSAMSMKYLGESFDIHTGGVDHIAIHHSNEIAQSEGATGKPLAKYWLHGEFLTVNGGRMGKSLGNAYTLHDIVKKRFNPLALRYLFLTAHYRTPLNFTWEALAAAQTALNRLFTLFDESRPLQQQPDASSGRDNGGLAGLVFSISGGKAVTKALIGCAEYEQKFLAAVNDDLDLPKALSLAWDLVKSDYPLSAKKASLLKFDEVLGLGFAGVKKEPAILPPEVQNLVWEREGARRANDFARADQIRRELSLQGFFIDDTASGPKAYQK